MADEEQIDGSIDSLKKSLNERALAHDENVERLNHSVFRWNKWRKENPDTDVDLEKADLSGSYLEGTYLGRAHMAPLTEADFRAANLKKANLSNCHLGRANFIDANLREANLSNSYLANANLQGANLTIANFFSANLDGAMLGNAHIGMTIFGDIDLSKAKDLEDVIHEGPSTIGTNTIQISKGNIPVKFLRGCGLSDVDIEYAKLAVPNLSNEKINAIVYRIYDLRATQAIQINPLFISYSHPDSWFVDEMEKYLNKKGIRFWRDIHDTTAGRLEKVVDRAMRMNPTVLLVLSENSIASDWVEHEASTARELEKELGRDVLCPVALDDAWKDCAWPARLREQIMEYNILDFSKWKDERNLGRCSGS
jgi:uncharacterized protein YjbI with pentapeptide repeats